MAQPAVSRMIHELERDCGGVALVEKIGRNLRLTEAGEALATHAQSILAEVRAADTTMRARRGLLAGRVSIGTPPSIGVQLLPETLATFHQTYPQIELRIHQAGTTHLLHLLEMGEIDIAIATMPIPSKNHTIHTLFDEPLVVVVSPQHRYSGRKTITLIELTDESFLLYPPGYEMHDVIVAACRTAGFMPRIVLEGGDVSLLLRLAEANLGIAIVPRLALNTTQNLVVLDITKPSFMRSMALVYRSDRTLSAASQELVDNLVKFR